MEAYGMLIVAAIIIGAALYYRYEKDKQLQSEGKIIKRGMGFMEKAELFILELDDPDKVTKAVQEFPYSEMKVSVQSDEANQAFQFSNSYGWNARLYCTERNEQKVTYCFEFSHWETSNGAVQGGLYMNMLQTAVEKMFLDIDPNTQVQEKALSVKTHHKLF